MTEKLPEQRSAVELIPADLEISRRRRTPLLLLLDTSLSMQGARLAALHAALAEFEQVLQADETLLQALYVCVISFGGAPKLELPWTPCESFKAPHLEAEGSTPLGPAMDLAIQYIDELRGTLRSDGVPYTIPWVVIISDGQPDPGWEPHAARSRELAQARRIFVLPMGVPPQADLKTLQAFADPARRAYLVGESKFADMFRWLGTSLGALAASSPGQPLKLPKLEADGEYIPTEEMH